MNNKELLFLFKEKFEIKTTEELGFILGQAATNVSAWQNNKKPMPMNIKFRLLEHINFSSETTKFAEVFVDTNEHQVLLQQDLDRIEDVQKRRQGEQGNFIDKKWIDRIAELQKKHELNDLQTATYLEMKEADFQKVKTGDAQLGLLAKSIVLLSRSANTETLKKNLNERLKK